MPRVADIYSRPAGIDAIPNQTIESADYNINVADVEADLNTPRPIVAGGTGANNATQARDNLDAERSMQQVFNYDSHVWEWGSFWSQSDATAPPIAGHSFHGTVYGTDQDNFTVQARDYADAVIPGRVYVRQKRTGSWVGAWALEGSGSYVELAGDTMTGDLSISRGTPTLNLTGTGGTASATIQGRKGGTLRWQLEVGNGLPELGGNSGSDFYLHRYNDVGSDLGVPFQIARSSGEAIFSNTVISNGDVHCKTLKASWSMGLQLYVAVGGDAVVDTQVAGARRWSFGTRSDGRFIINDITAGASRFEIDTGGVASLGANGFTSPGGANTQTGIALHQNGTVYASKSTGACFEANTNTDGLITVWHRSGNYTGAVSVTSTTTSYGTSSDGRLKEDLKSFDAGNIVDNTNVYDFAWKATGERSYGVIAQQANEVYPTAVHHDKASDNWGIDYSKYVPVLLQELKALRARVAELEDRVGIGVQPA